MEIVCLDMEGTLTPEIWERVSINTGIEELGQTTRDISSYEKLMDMILLKSCLKGITLSDVQEAAARFLNYYYKAFDFVSNLRKLFK